MLVRNETAMLVRNETAMLVRNETANKKLAVVTSGGLLVLFIRGFVYHYVVVVSFRSRFSLPSLSLPSPFPFPSRPFPSRPVPFLFSVILRGTFRSLGGGCVFIQAVTEQTPPCCVTSFLEPFSFLKKFVTTH